MRIQVASALLALVCGSPLQGQLRPLIPRSTFFSYPERTAPQLSPDATRIGYLRVHEGHMEIWCRTLGQQDDRAVTMATAQDPGNVTQFFWHADGRHLVFQRDPLGNRTAPLFLVDLTTGNVRNLTPWKEWVFLSVTSYAPRVDPNTVLLTTNKRDGHHYDVYRLDLTTGETTLDTEAPDDWSWMSWSVGRDNVVHGVTIDLPDGSHVRRTRTSATAPWHDLLHYGADEEAGIFDWQDGNRTLTLGTNVGSDTLHLETVELATGKRSILLRARRQAELGGIWDNPDTGKLDLVQYQGDIRHMEALDASLQPDLDALTRLHVGMIDGIDRAAHSSRWIVTFRTNAATWWYLYDRTTREATPIYADRPALTHTVVGSRKPVHLRARDGLVLHGYLTLPVDREPHQRLPLVLLVHGGPQRRDEWGFDSEAMWLADRGYAVLQVNFRGSDGFGKQFVSAGFHQWAGAMQTDLLDGKSWAVQHGYADPQRTCIMGGSYGGYATLAGLTFHPEAYACGVALAAPSDLPLMYKAAPHDNDFLRMIGTDPAEMQAASPDRFADRIRAPLLLAQGGADRNVRPDQGEAMVKAMRAANKPVTYYLFPEERHGFSTEASTLAFNAAVERFLALHLGGRFEPATPGGFRNPLRTRNPPKRVSLSPAENWLVLSDRPRPGV